MDTALYEHSGYRGFPAAALELVRCPADGQKLERESCDQYVLDGRVRCSSCSRSYEINRGILRLLDHRDLDERSRENLATFDFNATVEEFGHEAQAASLKDLLPTMKALAPLQGQRVLEYGCGNGRFTVRLAPRAAILVAVDFSIEALRKVASRLDPAWNVALVQADCTRPIAARRSFDRILCTLTSNLPNREQRLTLFTMAARAVDPGGRFVFSAHHYGLRARLKRTVRSGYYEGHRIFRYLSGRGELARETMTSFREVKCRPISILLPLEGRIRLRPEVSLWLEHIPLVNLLGELLLVTAKAPTDCEGSVPPTPPVLRGRNAVDLLADV
jgi:SAM-dependent methyltransferase